MLEAKDIKGYTAVYTAVSSSKLDAIYVRISTNGERKKIIIINIYIYTPVMDGIALEPLIISWHCTFTRLPPLLFLFLFLCSFLFLFLAGPGSCGRQLECQKREPRVDSVALCIAMGQGQNDHRAAQSWGRPRPQKPAEWERGVLCVG